VRFPSGFTGVFCLTHVVRALLPHSRGVESSRVDAAVVRQVLSYFVRHPHAIDDLEGIARWRLLEESVRDRVEETRLALSWLVEHDYLRPMPRGTAVMFGLNEDRAGEARAMLLDRARDRGSQDG
jgi:hypothetical protein